MQQDPIREEMNPYAYCEDKPTRRTDPSGEISCRCCAMIATVACAVVCSPCLVTGPAAALCFTGCMVTLCMPAALWICVMDLDCTP